MKFTNDRGTVAPLAIGLATISLATILTLASATSAFVFENRVQKLADSLSLRLKSLNDISQITAQAQLQSLSSDNFAVAQISKLQMADGATVELELCANWKNPLTVISIPTTRRVCSKAAAR